jgi:hypothetical protein
LDAQSAGHQGQKRPVPVDTDKLDERMNLVQWMIALNLAFTMVVLWKVFS